MKKNLFMVAAVAFMALISCNKENINRETESYTPEVAEPSYYVEFTADAANEPAAVPAAVQVKTTYDQTNKKTLWKSDDLISVNGKKRLEVEMPADLSSSEMEERVKALDTLKPYLQGKDIKKIIVVPNKLVNVVI
jgi:hypothetical protein